MIRKVLGIRLQQIYHQLAQNIMCLKSQLDSQQQWCIASLASQPLFSPGGVADVRGEKESGDLSQHFVFSAGMWAELMRLQQSHNFHSVIQRDSACDCNRCKAQLGYPKLCLKQELAVKNSFSRWDVLVSLLTGAGKSLFYYV